MAATEALEEAVAAPAMGPLANTTVSVVVATGPPAAAAATVAMCLLAAAVTAATTAARRAAAAAAATVEAARGAPSLAVAGPVPHGCATYLQRKSTTRRVLDL